MSQDIIHNKLSEISEAINEIRKIEPAYGSILTEGFMLSINLIEEITKNNGVRQMDISEHLQIISRVLGVSLEDLIMAAMPKDTQEVTKEADQATLEFITSDLDDYEKFLAQNKAKEDLDFLSKSI